jgi:hypothetical protein
MQELAPLIRRETLRGRSRGLLNMLEERVAEISKLEFSTYLV